MSRKAEYLKEWRKRNPDKVRLTNAMNLIKYYSMTKEERSEFNKKRVKFVKKLEKDSLLSADVF